MEFYIERNNNNNNNSILYFVENVAGNVRDARMTVARRGGPCERTASFAVAAAFRLAPSRCLAATTVALVLERKWSRHPRTTTTDAPSTTLSPSVRPLCACARASVYPRFLHNACVCLRMYVCACVRVCMRAPRTALRELGD